MWKLSFSGPKSMLVLAGGVFINMTGFSFVWPLTMIYLTQGWGESSSTAGVVMMLEAGAGALGSMSGGLIYDKIGGKTNHRDDRTVRGSDRMWTCIVYNCPILCHVIGAAPFFSWDDPARAHGDGSRDLARGWASFVQPDLHREKHRGCGRMRRTKSVTKNESPNRFTGVNTDAGTGDPWFFT
jgi:hypothetical protein